MSVDASGTTIDVHPDDPLHQRSGPGMAWSLGNSSEALPGVLTPLGWTFWRAHFSIATRAGYVRLGALSFRERHPSADPLQNFGAAFCGRYTASVELGRRIARVMPWASAADVDRALFGSVRSAATATDTKRRYPVIAWRLPTSALTVRRHLATLGAEVERWWGEAAWTPAPWPAGLAQQRVREAGHYFDLVMADHVVVTYLAQMSFAAIRRLAAHSDVDIDDLVVGGSSLAEGALLQDAWQLSHGSLDLPTFLHRHGYFGPRGGAIEAPSWREDPATLDGYQRVAAERVTDGDPNTVMRRRMRRSEQSTDRLLAALGPVDRSRARLAIKAARAFIPHREVGKAAFLRTVDVVRAAARVEGARLAESGVLASADDICYLTEDEFLSGEPPRDIRAKVEFRRARRQRYLALDMPQTWVGDPVPAQRIDTGDAHQRRGVGGSAGAVTGRARVVDSPDVDALDPDEILVCVSTDPAWAPVLFMAAGLVTELGGPLSHGAIIAREIGLPAVLNLTGATTWLRTGDPISIDGTTGVVTRIDAGEQEPGAADR